MVWRHAVGRGELRLFLQPLIDVPSEARTGYEALLRWIPPGRRQALTRPDDYDRFAAARPAPLLDAMEPAS